MYLQVIDEQMKWYEWIMESRSSLPSSFASYDELIIRIQTPRKYCQ